MEVVKSHSPRKMKITRDGKTKPRCLSAYQLYVQAEYPKLQDLKPREALTKLASMWNYLDVETRKQFIDESNDRKTEMLHSLPAEEEEQEEDQPQQKKVKRTKAPSAYQLFVQDIQSEYNDLKKKAMLELALKMWNSYGPEDREPYIKAADELKAAIQAEKIATGLLVPKPVVEREVMNTCKAILREKIKSTEQFVQFADCPLFGLVLNSLLDYDDGNEAQVVFEADKLFSSQIEQEMAARETESIETIVSAYNVPLDLAQEFQESVEEEMA